MKQQFIITDYTKLPPAIDAVKNLFRCEKVMVVTIAEYKDTRTLGQNKTQWPILEAFASQLLWPVNGQMVKMDADEWKDVLTCAFKQETVRLAMGLNGGVVMLGKRTSKFKKDEFSEWLEFLNSVAADRNVKIPVSKKYEKE
jgi:NinB protein